MAAGRSGRTSIRLEVFQIHVPSLRDRPADMASDQEILRRYNRDYDKRTWACPQAMSMLENYDWPGNVRD